MMHFNEFLYHNLYHYMFKAVYNNDTTLKTLLSGARNKTFFCIFFNLKKVVFLYPEMHKQNSPFNCLISSLSNSSIKKTQKFK